ncbi:uncharacterized protein LOC117907698 [Vitis riparia]|uniref:uncharacterized protein LOC117907698 n=1 Tax=Vitis riparia TaxID=96939 RepID=UPI00155AB3A9|nr:uncharacterized protein LOC117907698 [Vitis riparia]
MAIRKRSATRSVKSLWFVLAVLVLVVSTQSSFVHCRALRSTVDVAAAAAAAIQGDESVGVANSSAVSSNNSSKRSSVRSLTYKLASGPSKRGPGH